MDNPDTFDQFLEAIGTLIMYGMAVGLGLVFILLIAAAIINQWEKEK